MIWYILAGMKDVQERYVDVVLPLALDQLYTYAVKGEPAGRLEAGMRVVVQFGKKRYYTAIAWRVHTQKPRNYEAKEIEQILDESPLIGEKQRKLWEWMASYYLCTLGDVMNAALPAAMKLESETRILLHPAFNHDYEALNDEEYLLAEALTHHPELSIKEAQGILNRKNIFPILKSLIGKEVILLREELQEGYRPRIKKFVQLNPAYADERKRKDLFEKLQRAPRQRDILLQWFQLHGMEEEVSKERLLKASGKNYQALRKLIEKGILDEYEKEVSRIKEDADGFDKQFTLSPAQENARISIQKGFEEKDVVLLHGVTSSGKTEIYTRIIEEFLEQGKQVLYLLPEIALTTQMISRLKKYFGERIGIYHSRFSSMERVEIWQRVAEGKYQVVLGPRSALFLPFRNPGLIVVDEEHDPSYKQFDPAPRYHARDAAIYMARLFGAKTILGSATPSLESYYNARHGRYHLTVLKERYGRVELPKVELLDMRRSARMKDGKSHLSEGLVAALDEVLSSGRQAILFRNRRGYAPMMICAACAHVPQCVNCDVSLTYHKYIDKLKCHYCGYRIPTPHVCPACGSGPMRIWGYGTERIEDELKRLFDGIRVARLDLDAARGKYRLQEIINDFEAGRIDVLVGTQMVTKGLDFENVALVGILNADQLMHYPDFRSAERAFQLMVQVSGRAGRKKEQGKVLIQTRRTDHPLLQLVIRSDYESFYTQEISERLQFRYPPVYRMIRIRLRHRDPEKTRQAANKVHEYLAARLGWRAYPPVAPLISRIRGNYLFDIIIKMERKREWLEKSHQAIRDAARMLMQDSGLKSVYMYSDMDPY